LSNGTNFGDFTQRDHNGVRRYGDLAFPTGFTNRSKTWLNVWFLPRM